MKVTAPLEANVWKVLVSTGETVEAGQVLVVLEAMKMEIPVESPNAGVVERIAVEEGKPVADGGLVAVIR